MITRVAEGTILHKHTGEEIKFFVEVEFTEAFNEYTIYITVEDKKTYTALDIGKLIKEIAKGHKGEKISFGYFDTEESKDGVRWHVWKHVWKAHNIPISFSELKRLIKELEKCARGNNETPLLRILNLEENDSWEGELFMEVI